MAILNIFNFILIERNFFHSINNIFLAHYKKNKNKGLFHLHFFKLDNIIIFFSVLKILDIYFAVIKFLLYLIKK